LVVEIFIPKKRRSKVKVPNFKIGDFVYVVNKESGLHLEPATVVGRDHLHCRIKVVRNRKDILIWVPGSWLQKGF
jgi:hypothetical protein